MHEAHKLLTLLSRSRYGPKKRDYKALRLSLPTRTEWKEFLAQPGGQGGMLAEETDWQTMLTKHIECAGSPPERNMNFWNDASRDVDRLRSFVVHTKKRRAVPAGTLPAEIIAMCLAPNYNRNQSLAGVGMDVSTKLRAPATRKAFETAYMQLHRTMCTPLSWHSSQAAALGKPAAVDPKASKCKSLRLIHVLSVCGKAFYSTRHCLQPLHHNDTGFAKHRRKENAIITQNITAHRICKLGRSFVMGNST